MSAKNAVGMPVSLALAAILLASSGGAFAQDGRYEFQGSSSTTTEVFEVEAPWVLDWRVYSNFPQSMSIDIALIDSRTGMHQGQILQTREIGNGVKLFNEGGSYRLRIVSDLARWHIIIAAISEEEAERYTPVQPGGPLQQGRPGPFRQRN